MEIFGVSTLTVPNNVDLTINLVNGTSCYVLINATVTSPFFSSFTSKCFNWVIDWPSKGKLKRA